jgi:hypothetical protein
MYAEQQKSQFGNQIKAQAMTQAGGQIGGAVLGAGYTEPPRDLGGVERSLNQLRQQVAELGMCVENMGMRLRPVLLPESVTGIGGSGSAPQPVECDLVAHINEQSDNLNRMAQTMRSQMARLEI